MPAEGIRIQKVKSTGLEGSLAPFSIGVTLLVWKNYFPGL